jgi:hypothetical protein
VTSQVRGDERALDDDLESTRPSIGKGAGGKRTPDAAPLHGAVDLGVDEDDPVAVPIVFRDSDEASVEAGLVSALGRIVGDAHGLVAHRDMMRRDDESDMTARPTQPNP